MSNNDSWQQGYITDINYTYGYYKENNPFWSLLALARANIVLPPINTACELGYGQGISINIHAAASGVKWYGTDFNPSHAAFAQQLGRASQAGGFFYDQSFDCFCLRDDLPDFDFIAIHGIWSWINDENRQVIVDFIRRKLKVGGMLYISYNTMPGWSSLLPLRELMLQVGEASNLSSATHVKKSVDFLKQLSETKPQYFLSNTRIQTHLDSITKHNANYLAHEYLNTDNQPMYFHEIDALLKEAKVSRVASADPLTNIDNVRLTLEQQQLLAEQTNPTMAETLKDFFTNNQFRKDYWIKGPIQETPQTIRDSILPFRLLLLTNRDKITMEVKSTLTATLKPEMYNPILDILQDRQAHTIEEIALKCESHGIAQDSWIESLLILQGKGNIDILQPEAAISTQTKTNSHLFNDHIIKSSLNIDRVNVLASPKTGAGVPLSRIQQMAVYAKNNRGESTESIVDFIWQQLSQQNQKLIHEGKTLETEAENRDKLRDIVTEMQTETFAMLSSFGILA